MKKYEKPTFSLGEKIFYGTIVIVLSPLWVPMMIALFIWYGFQWWPISCKLRTQPLYWLTWHEVKLLTKKRSCVVLDYLSSASSHGALQCRYRDPAVMEKLRRRRSMSRIPAATGPVLPEQAIFFEFRIKDRVGKRKPGFSDFFSSFVARRQPAYT